MAIVPSGMIQLSCVTEVGLATGCISAYIFYNEAMKGSFTFVKNSRFCSYPTLGASKSKAKINEFTGGKLQDPHQCIIRK